MSTGIVVPANSLLFASILVTSEWNEDAEVFLSDSASNAAGQTTAIGFGSTIKNVSPASAGTHIATQANGSPGATWYDYSAPFVVSAQVTLYLAVTNGTSGQATTATAGACTLYVQAFPV